MQVRAKAFWLPKRGNAPEEYEDAFWPKKASVDTDEFRCAVADGATEASFAREWARALAKAFWTGALRRESFLADLEKLQAKWQTAVAGRKQGRQLAWYAEQKAHLGAFASLVGLTLHPAGGPEPAPWWEALAVGDSNLFQLRAGGLITAFPLTRSDQFNSGPYLIGSRPGSAGTDLLGRLLVQRGHWLPDDSFYLMSDALACWFLRCCEQGSRPWELLDALPPERDVFAPFEALVTELRDRQLLHNDDVTLVRVEVLAAEAAADPQAAVAGADAEPGVADVLQRMADWLRDAQPDDAPAVREGGQR